MRPSCLDPFGGRSLEEEKKALVDFFLVDRRPDDVQEKERNTIEDREVYKLQKV